MYAPLNKAVEVNKNRQHMIQYYFCTERVSHLGWLIYTCIFSYVSLI